MINYLTVIYHYNLKGKIFVLLVSTALLVGMLSGCVEEEIEANNAPVADFEWSPETISVNKTVEFTSTSTDADGDDLIYTWDFGDGSALSSDEKPTHIYNIAGFYNVTLEVNDGTTNNTKTQMINVGIEISSNMKPTANFTYYVYPTNLTVDFLDTSTDQDGNVVTWSWDFGDGNTSTDQNPTYVYATAATYNVTLTVKDDYGDTSSEAKEIVIE